MDASTGATNSGNGQADPLPESLPSAVVAPPGAPVSSSSAEAPAGALEPLVVVDRDDQGRIKKGYSLNPKGRAPGIPNKNAEFLKLLTNKQLAEVWAIAKKLATKGNVGLLEFLLDRALIKLTPEAAGIVINNNPQAHAAAHATQETHVNVAKLLADPRGREAVAGIAERLAACGAFPGRNGNGN